MMLILLSFIQIISLSSVNKKLKEYQQKKIRTNELKEALDDFLTTNKDNFTDTNNTSKYKFITEGLDSSPKQSEFDKFLDEKSNFKYYIFKSQNPIFNLQYEFFEKKCFKEIRFPNPYILNSTDLCYMEKAEINLIIGGERLKFDKSTWKSDGCYETDFLNISVYKNLCHKRYFLIPEIEIITVD